MGYFKDKTTRFTKVTENNNIGFDCKEVEDIDGKEDGKEVVTDFQEETSKKSAQRKTKRDVARARILLFIAVPELSATAFAFVLVPRLSPPAFESLLVPGLSAAVPILSVAILRSSAPASASVPVSELSAPVSASVSLPRLFAAVPELSVAIFQLSAPAFASILVPELSVVMSGSFLPKTSMSNLAAGRQKLDDTISG